MLKAMYRSLLFSCLTVAMFASAALYAGEQKGNSRNISIYGSSVASGAAATESLGYWHMLKECLSESGWLVSSCSRGGDTTSRALERYNDLLSQNPRYVFIGLSLANEGIGMHGKEAKDRIYQQYIEGLKNIVELVRGRDMQPIIGLCYPNSDYTEKEYGYIKRVNLEINRWDVPSANFLGAIEDGHGRWVEGYFNDPGHPNTEGHREMFYSIVPTLFDALDAGKATPQRSKGSRCMKDGTVVFEPQHTIHSWATALSFRSKQDGALASIAGKSGSAKIEIDDGKLVYTASNSQEIKAESEISDGKWHSIAVSNLYAQKQAMLFIDGKLAGVVDEQLAPVRFAIEDGKACKKDWFVYRAALNDLEAKALASGEMIQASLEMYAPLNDSSFKNGKPVENRAQSTSLAIFHKN
ncbi:MAG: GDSL-type esterase/lipase family protein [Phycisphaerae bacterium]